MAYAHEHGYVYVVSMPLSFHSHRRYAREAADEIPVKELTDPTTDADEEVIG